jgi:type I restriction enzyme, S subunit
MNGTQTRPGWETRSLRDVVTKLVDGSHNPPAKRASGLPMLSARNIENGRIVFSDYRFISEGDFSREHERTRVTAGDVFLTIVGSIGRAAVFPNGVAPFALQRSVAVMTPTGILPKFLMYQFQSPSMQRHFETNARGTAQKGIYLRTLADTPIQVAPLARQERIVAEIEKQFSRLDEAVANLKRVKANLKRYCTSILHAAIRGDLTIGPKGRPGSESAPCSLDRTDLGFLPSGWRWERIEDLASRQPRSIQSGPFGSSLLHSEFTATGKLVIGIDNVQDGRFSMGAAHRISNEKFRELERYAARPGDVLVTVMATIGRTCVVPQNIEPAIITKHVYRITPNQDVVLPEYLHIAIRGGEVVRAQLLGATRGQTRPGLNGSLLKKIYVPIPSIAEQKAIISEAQHRLSVAEEIESEVSANLERAKRCGKAILKRAFQP